MGGGAWPFLVRGVICLVNSDNERDSNILNRCIQDYGVEVCTTGCLSCSFWGAGWMVVCGANGVIPVCLFKYKIDT